jgi:hypothetical protein
MARRASQVAAQSVLGDAQRAGGAQADGIPDLGLVLGDEVTHHNTAVIALLEQVAGTTHLAVVAARG